MQMRCRCRCRCRCGCRCRCRCRCRCICAYVYVRVCCAPVTCLPGYDRRRAEFARWTSGLEQWLGSLPVAAELPGSAAHRTTSYNAAHRMLCPPTRASSSLSKIGQSLPLQRCKVERKPSWERRSSDVRKTELRRLGSESEVQSTSAPQWSARGGAGPRAEGPIPSAGGPIPSAGGPTEPAQAAESPMAPHTSRAAIIRARSANLTQ